MPSATSAPVRLTHERMWRKLFVIFWFISLAPLALVGGVLALGFGGRIGPNALQGELDPRLIEQIRASLEVTQWILVGLAIIMAVVIWLILRRLLRPMQKITSSAQKFADTPWEQRRDLPPVIQTQDEVEALSRTLNNLAAQTIELYQTLDSQSAGYREHLRLITQLVDAEAVSKPQTPAANREALVELVEQMLIKQFGCAYTTAYLAENSGADSVTNARLVRMQELGTGELDNRFGIKPGEAIETVRGLLAILQARPKELFIAAPDNLNTETPDTNIHSMDRSSTDESDVVRSDTDRNENEEETSSEIGTAQEVVSPVTAAISTAFTSGQMQSFQPGEGLLELFIPIGKTTSSEERPAGILDIVVATPFPSTLPTELQAIAAILGAHLRVNHITAGQGAIGKSLERTRYSRATSGPEEPITNAATSRRLAELETLWTISQAVSVETDLAELFQVIHLQAQQVMGDIASFAIVLYDATSQMLRIPYMVSSGNRQVIPPFPLGEGLSSIVIRSGQPLLIAKDSGERARQLGAKIVGGTFAKSWLGVPLNMSGQTIGLIIVQDTQNEGRFNEEDQRLLSLIASQVAVVVRNARLIEDARRQAEGERLLNTITAKIRRAVDIPNILQTTASELGLALQVGKAHMEIKIGEASPNTGTEAQEGGGER